MARNTTIKKIEKLKAKVAEIDERIKNDMQLKQRYVKEIESLEAESILIACKSSDISLSEAVESFELYSKLKSSGLSKDDLNELLSSNTTTSSPVDTKLNASEIKED